MHQHFSILYLATAYAWS